MCVLTVTPLADGWKLSVDGVQNDMVFASGAAAEAAARRLALRLAQVGTPAEVRILLRDHSLGARFICPPTTPDSRTAAPPAASQALMDLPQAA